MLILVFYTDIGVPATGLTVNLVIVNAITGVVIASVSMVEVSAANAPGWYRYNFATYDESIDYVITSDGGVGLQPNERYQFMSNDLSQVTTVLNGIDTRLPADPADESNQIAEHVITQAAIAAVAASALNLSDIIAAVEALRH